MSQTFAHGDGCCARNCTDCDIGCGGWWLPLDNVSSPHWNTWQDLSGPVSLRPTLLTPQQFPIHRYRCCPCFAICNAADNAKLNNGIWYCFMTSCQILVDAAAVPWWCSGRTLKTSGVSRSTTGAGTAWIHAAFCTPVTVAVSWMSAMCTKGWGCQQCSYWNWDDALDAFIRTIFDRTFVMAPFVRHLSEL